MKSGKLIGILAMYNYRLQPDMGCRKIAIRRIPCAYNDCLEQLDPVWKIESKNKKQRRYKTSNRCEIKKIVDGLNDWQVAKLDTSKNDDIDEDDLAKNILHGIENRMSEKIMKSN